MFVDLLEKLRCPNSHEPSPLIATATVTENRNILEGTLGCFICHAEFAIHQGAVDFGGDDSASTLAAPSDDQHLRLGALLGLDERGGLYVLDSVSARHIAGLAQLAPNARFIALSRDPHIGADMVIQGSGSTIPLAQESLRGVALDRPNAAILLSAVAALAAGGRLIAPADASAPGGISVIARDDRQWVGVRDAIPVISELRRAPR